MAATQRRAARVDDQTWAAAMRRATHEHRTVSNVIQVALRAYADGRYDAIEPAHRKGHTLDDAIAHKLTEEAEN